MHHSTSNAERSTTHLECCVIKLFANLIPNQTKKGIQDMSTKLCAGKAAEIQNTTELKSAIIATDVINGTCSFVAVVGNVVMILSILQNSSLRHNPSFMLVFNLAVSDVGSG